jgi:hypothetical protein
VTALHAFFKTSASEDLPNPILTPDQSADVIAFLLSLRDGRQPSKTSSLIANRPRPNLSAPCRCSRENWSSEGSRCSQLGPRSLPASAIDRASRRADVTGKRAAGRRFWCGRSWESSEALPLHYPPGCRWSRGSWRIIVERVAASVECAVATPSTNDASATPANLYRMPFVPHGHLFIQRRSPPSARGARLQ